MRLFQRVLGWILFVSLIFSLAACGQRKQNSSPTTSPTTIPTEATEPAATTPSIPTDPPAPSGLVDTTGMTDLQKAVVITAESYYIRGARAQYDQYNLTSTAFEDMDRRSVGLKAPEDYTIQHNGYTDCSSFVFDVYKFALGMEITSGDRKTIAYCASSPHTILREEPLKEGLTDEDRSAMLKKFKETLQPGDIIVYRSANNSSGHAMLYVGNNMIIHSTGSSYDTTNGVEKYEKSGSYYYESITNTILKKSSSRCILTKSVYVILRPLDNFKGTIPAHTQQRMNVMRCVIAEKSSSHIYSRTVNPGETVTFTFSLYNDTGNAKTLTVRDQLSDNVTYLSGADTVNGNQLSWTVNVPKYTSVKISYDVQVKADAPTGGTIASQSTVSGVAVNCPDIHIANTLTQAQQSALTEAFHQMKGGSLQGIDLANALYQKVFGKEIFQAENVIGIWADLIDIQKTYNFSLDRTLPLAGMVAPHLYGGRSMYEPDINSDAAQQRTRLVKADAMIAGDIILVNTNIYIFDGTTVWNLTTMAEEKSTFPEGLLAKKRFVVLRPSMMF